MATRCQAASRDGSPCSARPSASGWCLWHDPACVEERRQNSIKGGKAKSNRVRARKSAIALAMTPAELGGVLSAVLRQTIAGELETGVANAAANISRAMITVREATETEARLDALEEAVEVRSTTHRRYSA